MNMILLVSGFLVLGLASGEVEEKKGNGKCPSVTVNRKQFYKFTETYKDKGKTKPVADAPCWFDLTRFVPNQ